MAFTYFLPDENGNKTEHGTTSNAVIIIGANGSGKSKLGAWIEQQDMEQIHRIGAQRNLNFQENIPLKSYSQAEDFVFYGTDEKSGKRGKGYRWEWGKYTTKLVDDFDNVLAALIALKNNDNEKFVNECKAAPTREERPDPPFTSIDKLTQIWNVIFPQRKLQVEDAKFLAFLTRGDSEIQYNSKDFTNANLQMQFLHTPQEIQRVHQWINAITRGIQADYPFYATTLPCVANILFQQNEMGAIFLNPAAFGELVVIVRHIEAEPVVVQFWSAIHPRIVNVSHELYADGHCSTAAEKAVKEVESRLREKYSELKLSAAVPVKIGDVIGALMSENGAFKFCDTTTTSGKDYRRGIHSLFEGIMAAYRNPAAHANLQYEKREAMEQIMLASQLMYVLDKPQI